MANVPNRAKPAKCVNKFRVSGVDGLKEVSVGPAKYDDRMRGDFSKDGKVRKAASEGSLDDQKARAERYGFDLDSSEEVGLGLF